MNCSKLALPDQGFTLLEVLTCVFLFSLLGIIVTSRLQASQVFFATTRAKIEAEESFTSLLQVLDRGLDRHQSLLAVDAIRFHPPGALRDAAGQDIIRSRTTAVAPGSTPVSFLRLNPAQLLRRLPGEARRQFFCSPARLDLTAVNETGLWLVLTADGYCEAAARTRLALDYTARSVCASGIVYEVPLEEARHPLFTKTLLPSGKEITVPPSRQTLVQGAIAIVPIEESFTIYRDSRNTVRRVSHQTLDNQPVLYGAEELIVREEQNHSILIFVRFAGGRRQQTRRPLHRYKPLHPLDMVL